MKKSKWALFHLNQHSNIAVTRTLLPNLKRMYQDALKYFDNFETRFAKPILLEMEKIESTIKAEDMSPEMKKLFAESKTLLADITFSTSTGYEDSKKAFLLSLEALKLNPNLKRALYLNKSLDAEHDFTTEDPDFVKPKQ